MEKHLCPVVRAASANYPARTEGNILRTHRVALLWLGSLMTLLAFFADAVNLEDMAGRKVFVLAADLLRGALDVRRKELH
jgi:hypothetical protein